jgi:hypothetical protein
MPRVDRFEDLAAWQRARELTVRNPPQAAALERVRLGGFLAGFSQHRGILGIRVLAGDLLL